MRGLLLDENISPVVADQVSSRRPDISISDVLHWPAGSLENQPDELVLRAATEAGLTLVTYDVTTIRPLVMEWHAAGRVHAGVIFINRRTIASNDFGGLIRAIERFWDIEHLQDWTNRTDYLRPA
jgi:hypothetical protein